MLEKTLREVLDPSIIKGKKICIDEVLPQNVDAIVIEIADLIKAKIFSFSETIEHYQKIAREYNKNIYINSIYNNEFIESEIIDDIWTAKNIHGLFPEGHIYIYRSNTCDKIDWYLYDVIIRVLPLSSGVSNKIDGTIKILSKNKKEIEFKYKVMKDRCVFY